MRACHSLHITIKAQTQKHIVHWTHVLRALPHQKGDILIADQEELEKLGASDIASKTQRERNTDQTKR